MGFARGADPVDISSFPLAALLRALAAICAILLPMRYLVNRCLRGKVTKTTRCRIGMRAVEALQPDQELLDTLVRGFRARRQKGEALTYSVVYRNKERRQRRASIGFHGAPWTPDEARKEAQRILGEVAAGGDPAAKRTASRKAETVAELCDLYWRDADSGRLMTRRREPKKASTLATDKGRIERHIKPLLGALKVAAVSREDVRRFMHAVADGKTAGKTKSVKKHGLANVRGGRGTASRTVGLLGAIFAFGVEKGIRPDNPVRGVVRFADGKRERRLSNDEYAALGEALRASASIWPPAVAAVRFLALTGWRLGEALALEWAHADLDWRTATLPDTKTGRSVRPLSRDVCHILSALPRLGPRVFPASRGLSGLMTGFRKPWERIAKLGALPGEITPHTLRHSFASLASDLGYSEPTIAVLIGHKGRTVTSRYVHAADAVLLAAADAVANKISGLMLKERRADRSFRYEEPPQNEDAWIPIKGETKAARGC
jgi:integrase